MKYNNKVPALLVLQDGKIFEGFGIGKRATAFGEICFNTGMTGYQEMFTDPSYFGQIFLATVCHVGNYGIREDEVESGGVKISALVCKEFTGRFFSRPSANSDLNSYFEKHGVVGMYGVDTRLLVRHIRNAGAMNAVVSTEEDADTLLEKLKVFPQMSGLELASKVATKVPYYFGNESSLYKVAVIDYGVKLNILRCLADRNCYIKVFPYNAAVSEILAWNPDGIMLSNGPGDPASMPNEISVVRELIASPIPVFGICLGHQIISLAMGLNTYKMHNGHRGVNHPVKNILTTKCEITSQNHGFVVDYDAAVKHPEIEVTHVHLNDGTLAGISIPSKNTFSVQFHPESSAGPNDSRYLFDEFVSKIQLFINNK